MMLRVPTRVSPRQTAAFFRAARALAGLGDLAPCPSGQVRDPKPGGVCWDLSTMCPTGSNVCPAGTWAVPGINVPWGQYALPGAGGIIPGIPLLDPTQTTAQQLASEEAAGIAPAITPAVPIPAPAPKAPVNNPPATNPPAPAAAPPPAGSSSSSSTAAAPTPVTAGPSDLFGNFLSTLQAPLPFTSGVLGSIPLWMWLAGGGGVLFFVFKGGRR